MGQPLSIATLNPPLKPTLVTNEDGLALIKGFISRSNLFGFDTETNKVDHFTERKIRTIQIGNREEQYVIDLLMFAGSTEVLMEQGYYHTPEWAKPVVEALAGLTDWNKTKVGVNLEFDYQVMRWCLGMRTCGFYDCMLAEMVIYCGRVPFYQKDFWGMDDMAKRYLNFEVDKALQTSFDLESLLTPEQIAYAALDTRVPLAIRQCQLPTINKASLDVTVNLENDAIPAFGDLHINGVYLDTEEWTRLVLETAERHREHVKQLDTFFIPVVGSKTEPEFDLEGLEAAWRNEKDRERRAAARKEYQGAARMRREWLKNLETWEGEAAINYGSTTQLLSALRKMGLTEHKLPNTNDKVLKTLADKYPVIKALQNYRETAKVDSTYGVDFPRKSICSVTGRVHSRFHQIGAETGRVSSSSPNMQNIPNGPWRGCFKARNGWKLLTVDMSGAELRIAAEASGEEVWLDAFSKGIDVHSVCARMMQTEVWDNAGLPDCHFAAEGKQCSCPGHKKLRKAAKAINFGVMYGKEARALADDLGISVKEARELLDLWRKTFPKLWAYLVASGKYAQEHLCSRTLANRRRLFTRPDWNVARQKTQEQFEEDGKNPLSITSDDISRTFKGMYARIDRQGKNTPIQGTNVDIAKVAMALMWVQLESKYGACFVGMVHDELIIECPEETAPQCFEFVMECIRMAGARFLKKVVMESDGKIGDKWEK